MALAALVSRFRSSRSDSRHSVCELRVRAARAWQRICANDAAIARGGILMSTLLLLRHGEVPGISPPTFRGRRELELTERGRSQARRTGARVHAGWPKLAALYCSPRHRTVATAQAI